MNTNSSGPVCFASFCRVPQRLLLVFFLAVLGGGGCSEEDPVSFAGSRPVFDLQVAAGNNQTGRPGQLLENPLEVQAISSSGQPLANVVVVFTVTSGSGTLSDSTGTTGGDGRVRTYLTLGPQAGLNQVTVSAVSLEGLAPVFTSFAEGAPLASGSVGADGRFPDAAHFSLQAETINLPGRVEFGLTTQVTAFVIDASSNFVEPGTLIRFRTTGGGIGESALTDESGQARVVLTTAEPIPEDGLVRVSAQTQGRGDTTITAETGILFSGPTQIRLLEPVEFAVLPGQELEAVFFVGDSNGHPLAASTRIRVSAVGGTVRGQTDIVLEDTQDPEATRYAVVFRADEDGGETAELNISVTSPNGDLDASFAAKFQELVAVNAPASLVLEAQDSLLVADGISGTTISATLRDSSGNGIPNEIIQFKSSVGAVDVTALTDDAGRASVRYRSTANPAGVAEVRLEAIHNDLAATTSLRLLGTRLRLEVDPAVIAADGIERALVTAVFETEAGDPVPAVEVEFSASFGAFSAVTEQTDIVGRATVVYTAPVSSIDLGDVLLRATAAGLDAAQSIGVHGVSLQMSASEDSIAADGNSQSEIRVRLERIDGRPLAGSLVRFETNFGVLSNSAVLTDEEGTAETILVSGLESGNARVRAIYVDGIEGEVAVALAKGPPASIVMVDVDPPSIGIKGSGGDEESIVTFEVRDLRGNIVEDGTEVIFDLDAPDNSGEQVKQRTTATVQGRVEAAVLSGTVARTIRLIASVPRAVGDTIRSTPVPVAIHGGLPDQQFFSLAARPVNLAGRVLFGLESTISAFVFDKFSNPVLSGTSVRFRTDGGGVQGATETNANGQGQVVLFTAEPIPAGPDFLAQITGQTVDENGNEIEASTTVLFSGPTAPIRILGDEEEVAEALQGVSIADGSARLVRFRVSDVTDLPLMGGSTIRISSDVAAVSGDVNLVIPDVRSGHTDYSVVISDPEPEEDPPEPPKQGAVLISVNSPNGNQQFSIGVAVD